LVFVGQGETSSLVTFAAERGLVLIGVTHFTKGTADKDPVERVTGFLAFAALARIVLGASADEDGHQRRLVRIASNIGPIFQAPLPEHDFSAQRIQWGTTLTGAPKDLLSGSQRSAQPNASAFLAEVLKDGPHSAKEVKAGADAHGHSWATIRRAQVRLNIKPTKDGDRWVWQLPPKMSTFVPG
jgi:putative DNA primase/helicase